MKKIISFILLSFLLTPYVLASDGNASAEGTSNPFLDGTQKRTLTEEEKTDLLKYADTSRARLLKVFWHGQKNPENIDFFKLIIKNNNDIKGT